MRGCQGSLAQGLCWLSGWLNSSAPWLARRPACRLQVQLQEAELARITSQRAQSARRCGSRGSHASSNGRVDSSRRELPHCSVAQSRPSLVQALLLSMPGGCARQISCPFCSLPCLTQPPLGTRCREEPGWRTLTTLFIALVSAAFVAIYVLSIWQNGWSIENPNLNPLIGGSQSSLMKLGAQSQPAIVDSAQWWRLVTSMWVSAGECAQ